MSPALSTRRRAEQFDALLDGTSTTAPSAELADLAALVGAVRSVDQGNRVAPRPEFAADLRARLMSEAADALAAGAAETTARLTVHQAPARARRERRVAVAAAALSIVGATGASAVASQGSAPGDTLYPVKRLIEDAKVSLAMGDDARADALLSQARTRLSEARDLAGRDEIDTAAVSQALEDFTDSADHASGLVLADYADNGDEQAVSDLRRFSQDGVTALSQLADVLPDSLHGPLTDAVNTLLAIDDSAAQACPSCDGGITVLPTTLIDLLASTTGTTAGTTGAEPSASGAAVSPPSATVPTTAPAPAPSATSQAGEPTDGSKHLPSGAAPTGQPTSSPTSIGGAVGQLGGTLGDTLGGVGGTVGGLGDAVGGPVGGLLGGVGGAVDGLGGTVGGTVGAVGGALDGVLGGATQTPKP